MARFCLSCPAVRLKALLRKKLVETGWHDRVQSECEAEIRRRGIDSITAQELVDYTTSKAKSTKNIERYIICSDDSRRHPPGNHVPDSTVYRQQQPRLSATCDMCIGGGIVVDRVYNTLRYLK